MPDFEPYLSGWRERFAKRRLDAAATAQRAERVARRLAQRIVDRYGARRVVLMGSLARGDFAEGSDIDLAVEGLPPDVFFSAGADIEAAAEGFSVDLVPIESATPLFLERIREEGIALA